MRLLFIIILSSAVGCQNSKVNSKSVQNSGTTNKISLNVTVPQKVTDYIKSNLAGWIIPDTSDYIKAWWSFYDKDQIPYFVATDLNDDNIADYAFILKNSNSIRLIIIIAKGNSFTHWIANNFDETYKGKVKNIQFGLNIESPGLTDCVVDNKECALELKSSGIALMTMERKSIIYYWLDGEIKSFRVVTKLSDYTIK